MRRILFLSFCVLFFILTSCSSDDGKITLNKTSISLYSEETSQLTASESVEWETEDLFVASVDNEGIVEGQHVGKTYIVASSSNGESKCQVEVKAKYNTYTEPLFDFGSSKATIKNKDKRGIYSETATALTLTPTDSSLDFIMYMFEDDKMASSAAIVKLASAMEATYFLLERYYVVSAGTNGFAGIMINNLPAKATMVIGATVQSSYYMVIYAPHSETRSASDMDNLIDELTIKYVDLLKIIS